VWVLLKKDVNFFLPPQLLICKAAAFMTTSRLSVDFSCAVHIQPMRLLKVKPVPASLFRVKLTTCILTHCVGQSRIQHTDTHTHMHTYTHVHTCTHKCTHAYTNAHTPARMHARMHACTDTHTQGWCTGVAVCAHVNASGSRNVHTPCKWQRWSSAQDTAIKCET